MEFFLLLIVGGIIYSVVENYLKNNNTTSTDSYQPKHNSYDIDTKTSLERLKEIDFGNENKKESHTVINNYYTQNNTYVQQNHYYKKSKSKDEDKDHSEKIWNELGYKIKYGETYSYKMYGKKIYTPDQVEKIGSYQIRYSETGLAKKLLNDTGSKSHTKDILVKNYSVLETKAQSLVDEAWRKQIMSIKF